VVVPRRIVLFVEGDGDRAAVPALARKALNKLGAHDVLVVDDGQPFEVDGVGKLVKDDCANWRRWLRAAAVTRKSMGAVLLVLDGDVGRVPPSWKRYVQQHKTNEFCAYRVAAMLADEARAARGGEAFSVAVVFVMQEFEAWLVAGVESLRGVQLAEGRATIPGDAVFPNIDIEAKRDAKGELRKIVPEYSERLDQGILARKVDPELVFGRCKSFRRFTRALGQLADAARGGRAMVSPAL
jgi:hypothetical protein